MENTFFNDFKVRRKILAQRGDYVLESFRHELVDEFRWCTLDVEFDHSLLIWHIATDLCYYNDCGKASTDIPQCKTSKCLSDYMLYLLVLRPAMLPKRIAEIRSAANVHVVTAEIRLSTNGPGFTETCDGVKKFLQTKQVQIKKTSDACKMLLETVEITSTSTGVDEENDLLVLSSGCKLAKQLQTLESQYGLNFDEKWRMISRVWIEMLGHAASHCEWKQHVQHLGNGGELLTHVCLLMTHLGFSEQYRLDVWDIS